jgi:hypothetical protein
MKRAFFAGFVTGVVTIDALVRWAFRNGSKKCRRPEHPEHVVLDSTVKINPDGTVGDDHQPIGDWIRAQAEEGTRRLNNEHPVGHARYH